MTDETVGNNYVVGAVNCPLDFRIFILHFTVRKGCEKYMERFAEHSGVSDSVEFLGPARELHCGFRTQQPITPQSGYWLSA